MFALFEIKARVHVSQHSLRGSLKQEFEAEKMLAIASIEKRCSKDIEEIRKVEREKATHELERVKQVFLARERETAEDLHALEELHADHIMKLVGLLHTFDIITSTTTTTT